MITQYIKCVLFCVRACMNRCIHMCMFGFTIQMLLKAGVEGKQTVFLFSDNQIKDESFVEDINMILNTGDVPNIYPADEKADIIEKMQAVARALVMNLEHLCNYSILDNGDYFGSLKNSRPFVCPIFPCF